MNLDGNTIGKLTIIGAGAMGTAFAKGVISANAISAADVTLVDVDMPRLDLLNKELGVRTLTSNAEAVAGANVILLAVKPAVVAPVLKSLAEHITSDQLIISIAAGVTLKTIEDALAGTSAPAIRVMPNTPCQIGAGAIAFCRGNSVSDTQVDAAKKIFDAVGISFEVPESKLDAVTGLSGSGPAYVYLIIEALSDAGVAVGLTRDMSLQLAAQTVLGSAQMVLSSGKHPAQLKDQVTSPGGTTIAGVEELERYGVRSAIIEAVKAAASRSAELG